MTNSIDEAQWLQLSELVARSLGLHYPKERWDDLERGVYAAAQESGYSHKPGEYVAALLSPSLSQKTMGTLTNHLTVGETYFFREKRSLDAFEKTIVPQLLRTPKDKAIKVWSAGCSTGEEAYSIAMILQKLGLEDRSVQILATDLNAQSLEKASMGVYGEWSFRGTPPPDRAACFDRVDRKHWAVRPVIRQMVSFAQLNLAVDFILPPPFCKGSFDVIFCRNVLMYFAPGNRSNVVQRLSRSLSSDGWLIVSPAETSHQLFGEFEAVTQGGATLYRKSKTPTPAAVPEPFLVSEQNSLVDWPARLSTKSPALTAAARPDRSVKPQSPIEQAEPDAGPEAHDTFLRAQAYANRGELTLALNYCDQAIAADKLAVRPYFLRATILQEQGALPEAVCSLKQTIYVEPRFILGHMSLGSLTLIQGNRKESEKHFKNALLLLAHFEPEEVVPESQGLSAGRLREMILSECGAGFRGAGTLPARGR